jgi:hypothetical protein
MCLQAHEEASSYPKFKPLNRTALLMRPGPKTPSEWFRLIWSSTLRTSSCLPPCSVSPNSEFSHYLHNMVPTAGLVHKLIHLANKKMRAEGALAKKGVQKRKISVVL